MPNLPEYVARPMTGNPMPPDAWLYAVLALVVPVAAYFVALWFILWLFVGGGGA